MELSDFKAYVLRDFKRTDKDVELVQAYNDMIKWISVKMPIGDYKFQSYVPTSIGIEDYELPCDLLHLFHPIKLIDGANLLGGYPLEHISKNDYDIREPNPNGSNPALSKPSAYTVWSRSILLTPVPDLATYVMEINWGKRPVNQVVNADTPSLGNEYDEVLKWGTLERLYAGMQRYDEAVYWGSKFHDADDKPSGALRDLLQAEISREGEAISNIKANRL